MVTIKVIAGSTRPGRFNKQVADWVYEQAQKYDEKINVELVDLNEINLPLLDEEIPASRGQYANEHTKKWAKIVDEADGFIIVTPEYNHSLPAALKNAIDFVFAEWHYKPVSFVSYGSLAGGARAVEHLRGIAGEVRMFDLREQLLLPNYWDNMNESGKYEFTDEQAEMLKTQLTDLVFWAERMKSARAELNA